MDKLQKEVEFDTNMSKALGLLGKALIAVGFVLGFIVLGRNEADILAKDQLIKLLVAIAITVAAGIWTERKSQKLKNRKTFAEYMSDKSDYDRLQDEIEYEEDELSDYDRLQEGSVRRI